MCQRCCGRHCLRLVRHPNLDWRLRLLPTGCVLGTLPPVFPASWGLATGPAITFFLFWLLNMYVVYLGVESIRKLLVFKAFFLLAAALALLLWAISAGHGLGPVLAQTSHFTAPGEF